MRDTTITIQRPEGTVLATHVRVQVDQVSLREAFDLSAVTGRRAVDYFKLYTAGWYASSLLQAEDLLVDELENDPEITLAPTPYRYRVVGRVKNYEYDHQEVYAEIVRGG